MNKKQTLLRILFVFLALVLAISVVGAQEREETPKLHFQFEPDSLVLGVGDTISVSVRLLDENNKIYEMPFLLFGQGRQARRAVEVKPRTSGPGGSMVAQVVAHLPGLYRLAARTVTVKREDRKTENIPVEIAFPPLKRVVFENPRKSIFVGTTVAYAAKVFDAADLERKGLDLHFQSNRPEIASFDGFGNLTAHRTGPVSISAEIEGIRTSADITIEDNPVIRIELASNMEEARTGDVVQFQAVARDGLGRPVEEAPIYYSLISQPLEKLGPAPAAEIDAKGRFVAETPGYYTVVAHSGLHVSRSTVKIRKREQQKKLELVGHGKVLDVFTSDLWIWEGLDGRDYAVTGTWGANGDTYFWDVTDPANMKTIDTVRVDARTVNDVKVSEDGRIAVISREGASNRRNGIVILDVADPGNVKVLSRFDDQLTGGVHNVFIYENHVYAVNNSIRYDVINI
ncbi:hypothetical protein MJD09_26930, partial [bacterium]|nr:hypothetical protein [bacterium]